MTAATTTPATYGPGRASNGLPGVRGAGILLSALGSCWGGLGLGVDTPTPRDWAVRRAASAAAWLSWPWTISLSAAPTAASWTMSLPPISRRTQFAQNLRA